MPAPRLSDTAAAIRNHLERFAADPVTANRRWTDGSGVERTTTLYFRPNACVSGGRCAVVYVSYQGKFHLTREQAERYLAWLDAGNVGHHHRAMDRTI